MLKLQKLEEAKTDYRSVIIPMPAFKVIYWQNNVVKYQETNKNTSHNVGDIFKSVYKLKQNQGVICAFVL